ncbi:tripartite motif-containing protein 2-like [Ptychodera flava]|uniref:tripartite motif-containing protein 2-like n=1 Tax=Ptychodera flava TaxID=63121 RepID=UPI00396A2BBC
MAAHREHINDVKDLQTAAAEWTELLNGNLQKMGFKEKKTAGLKKTLREMIKAVDELYERGENKIKEWTQRTLDFVKKKIEENERVLLEELKQIHDSNKTTLNAKIKELDCIESDSSSVTEFVEAVKHHGNATHLMSVRKGLTSRIEELLSLYDDVSQIEPCSIFEFLPCGDFLEEGKLGEVAIDKFQFKEIPEFVRVGDEVNIKLVTVSQQQKLNVSEEDIQVDVTSSTDETVATMVTGNEDGTFSITWQATTEGLYNVSTSVLGKPTGTVAVIKIVPKKGLLHVFKEDKKGAFPVAPYYSAVSSDGLIFITSSDKIALINGKDARYFGEGIIESAVGIAVHPLNKCVYVVDKGARCVRVFSNDGVYIFSFGREHLEKPRCICINNGGDVMVSDEGKNSIEIYRADGQYQYTLSSNLSLKEPEGIAVDKDGCVYVCDYGNSRVLKVDSRGNLISCIAKVEQPMGICVTNDTPPRVIVADNVESLRVVRVFAQ